MLHYSAIYCVNLAQLVLDLLSYSRSKVFFFLHLEEGYVSCYVTTTKTKDAVHFVYIGYMHDM